MNARLPAGCRVFACAALGFLGLATPLHAAEDILIADFEGPNYGAWQATGEAFGRGPAHGTLPNQMPVDGFAGGGLVNSFLGGDAAVGTLTSPAFTLERAYLSFLIGGGGWSNLTCLNLLVNGQAVRTATGPNTQPSGHETLAAAAWDVREFAGQRAVLEIVDRATGGWGHINVDQIVQTDRRPPQWLTNARRQIVVAQRYLNLPVKHGAPKRQMRFAVAGQPAREFAIELADGVPDWWAFMDLTPFAGRAATLTVDRLREDSTGLSAVDQTDEIKSAEPLYTERLRPQLHFSSRRGWLNDPNGLVFYQGEYHLFYQHNPYGWDWGNMHWGHAVSPDLVHWRELPIALCPDEHGTMYSGSAVVDEQNTAGFQTGAEPALVAMFTAAGKPFTQGLAYSNDRGRTWTKFAGNPVLPHLVAENRDPKVIWYAPGRKWVMALYLDRSDFALFASSDLKQWQRLSNVTVPGSSECPEFFPLAVDGDPANERWIFYGGKGLYLVGRFDGTNFTAESGPHALHHGNCWYASQTFNGLPASDGRRILIPWGQVAFPGMAFNQMMGLPVSLTLRTTPDGLRLAVEPVKELAAHRVRTHEVPPQTLRPGENPLAGFSAELLELEADLSVGEAREIRFLLRGVPVVFDAARQTLTCTGKSAPLPLTGGRLRLRAFVDRTSVDLFGNDGRLYQPMSVLVTADQRSVAIQVQGGPAQIHSLRVHELRSAWR